MAESGASPAPIIIKKKKGAHAGHHGGAWKVAYADFVTAMMALFIVLWLMNSSKPVKEAVASYFQDPSGKGVLPGGQGLTPGTAPAVAAPLPEEMTSLKDKLEKTMSQMPAFKDIKNQVEIKVTNEGLKVELLE